MIRSYRFPIAPNSGERLQIFGDYIRVYSSAQTLRVKTSAGDEVELREGDEVECREFEWIEVSQDGLVQIAIDIAVGDKHTSLKTSRVNGLVHVVNGEVSRAKESICFIGLCGSPPVVGQYSQAQLWNPSTSGKILIINNLNILSSVVCTAVFKFTPTALSTVYGSPLNKMSGGTASVAEIRYQSSAVQSVGPFLGAFGIPLALGESRLALSEPLIVMPNTGLLLESQTQNSLLTVGAQWIEEKI